MHNSARSNNDGEMALRTIVVLTLFLYCGNTFAVSDSVKQYQNAGFIKKSLLGYYVDTKNEKGLYRIACEKLEPGSVPYWLWEVKTGGGVNYRIL